MQVLWQNIEFVDQQTVPRYIENRGKLLIFHEIVAFLLSRLIHQAPQVLALESIKDAQAAKISTLKSRIKKLEKKCKPILLTEKPQGMVKECIHEEEIWKEGVWRQSGGTKEVKLTDDTEVVEDKGSGDKGGNAKELVSTARPDIDATRQEDSDVEPTTPPDQQKYNEKELAGMERERDGKKIPENPTSTQLEVKPKDEKTEHRASEIGYNVWKKLQMRYLVQNPEKWIIKSWTFYENCRVHILALEDGTKIHMLIERSKELASPKQTALGKEALAIPEQTDTGKEISNPFMAGSLAKNYIANLVGEDCWVLEDFTTNAAVQHCAASEDLVLLIKIKENRLSL
ncbi:hypothetical protein Tco_0564600 [Tanacetum coccineum]